MNKNQFKEYIKSTRRRLSLMSDTEKALRVLSRYIETVTIILERDDFRGVDKQTILDGLSISKDIKARMEAGEVDAWKSEPQLVRAVSQYPIDLIG